MHLPLLHRWLLALLLGLGSQLPARATHLRGGDLTYTCVSPSGTSIMRYRFVVRLFYDAAPLAAGPSPTIDLHATSNNCQLPTSSLSQTVSGSAVVVGSAPLACSTGAALYSVYTYATELSLPAGQWLITTNASARLSSLQNVVNGTSQSCYLSAYLDNTLAEDDNSPMFESALQPMLSAGSLTPHSFSAFDADGDSLRYELELPRGAGTGNCATILASTLPPHFQLNTTTGALTPVAATASMLGYYNITVRVSEYRRLAGQWQLIGSVGRDNTYVVASTPNQPPRFTSAQVNGGPVQALSPIMLVQPGQLIQLTLAAADPDAGQQLRFASDALGVVPGLSLTTLAATQVRLAWQVPATLPPGRYTIPVAVLDNGCPYSASEERTFTFIVTNQPLTTRAAAVGVAAAYPTPFREQVQFAAAPGQVVVIMDALGREVARLQAAPNGHVQWQPGAGLPAGLYLARAAQGQFLARLLYAAGN